MPSRQYLCPRSKRKFRTQNFWARKMWDSDDFVLTRRDTIKRKLSKTISIRSLRTKVWSSFNCSCWAAYDQTKITKALSSIVWSLGILQHLLLLVHSSNSGNTEIRNKTRNRASNFIRPLNCVHTQTSDHYCSSH